MSVLPLLLVSITATIGFYVRKMEVGTVFLSQKLQKKNQPKKPSMIDLNWFASVWCQDRRTNMLRKIYMTEYEFLWNSISELDT